MRKIERLTTQQSAPTGWLVTVLQTAELEASNFTINEWIDIFSQMVEDETIAYASELFAHLVCANIVQYEHPKKKVEDFVNENFARMSKSLLSVLTAAVMDMNDFGFHISEVVYKYEDGKLWLDKFVRLDPATTRFLVD